MQKLLSLKKNKTCTTTMSLFYLSPHQIMNVSNNFQIFSGAMESYLGVGDFVTVDVFETDVVVGRIIDVALFSDIPNESDAVSADEG